MNTRHEITRHRFELVRRTLTVSSVAHVTPAMLRIGLSGPELAGFSSPSPDDHVKLSFPGEGGQVERRDYTPRRHDAVRGELLIDFAVHEAGPATRWAVQAAPGDTILMGGPRGSTVVPADFDWWLLVGDETALPAIGRRIEELPAGVDVISLVAVTGPAEQQRIATQARHTAHWVHRPPAQAAEAGPLLAVLDGLVLPPGDGFVWIAGEAKMARAVRTHVTSVMQHPPAWVKAAGYWAMGAADAHEKIED